jgi:sialate O-acetylesterase
MKRISIVAVVLAFAIASSSYGDVTLSTLFRDGVILQRGKPVPVWGTADAGERVSVSFGDQTKSAVADKNGKWMIQLDQLKENSTPSQLTANGKNSIVINNVLVGEVWLCSGQSNMQHPLSASNNAKDEIAQANAPLVRYFDVKASIEEEPTDEADGTWQDCTPATAGNFTAVGYFFGREIQRELGVPVGIIKASLGGSPIEGWMNGRVLSNTPAAAPAFKKWEGIKKGYIERADEYRSKLAAWKERHKDETSEKSSSDDPRPTRAWVDGDRNKPGGLYNGFIYPLKPFALAGFVWYQGEGNVPSSAEYKILFPMMISQWRRDSEQPDLPFLFVQLPNYDQKNDATNESWPWQRESQAAALKLPNVGMAVTIDIGDPVNLHPGNKKDVGKRLALIAMNQVYKRKTEDSGPVHEKVTKNGDSLRIRFVNADGLAFRGDSAKAFIIAGADRKFVPADARVEGDAIVLRAEGVAKPVAARLDWTNNPMAFLVNKTGLPAAPFRTDDWSKEQKP